MIEHVDAIRPVDEAGYRDLLERSSPADLRRVDGPGRLRWHASAIPDGDYAINAPYDLGQERVNRAN